MKTGTSRNDDRLNSKLAAYSATAVAALLVAPTAEATVYDFTLANMNNSGFSTAPGSITLPQSANHNYNFTLATANYHKTFKASFNVFKNALHATINIQTDGSRNNRFLRTNISYKANLAKGERLAGLNTASGLILAASGIGNQNNTGSFHPQGASAFKTGYLGFKEKLNGNTYYGWLHLKIVNDSNGKLDTISLIDNNGNGIMGAMDTKNDLGIDGFAVGVTQPVSTPEPSSPALGDLGLLALGAAGVREMRRRRQAEKVS